MYKAYSSVTQAYLPICNTKPVINSASRSQNGKLYMRREGLPQWLRQVHSPSERWPYDTKPRAASAI